MAAPPSLVGWDGAGGRVWAAAGVLGVRRACAEHVMGMHCHEGAGMGWTGQDWHVGRPSQAPRPPQALPPHVHSRPCLLRGSDCHISTMSLTCREPRLHLRSYGTHC